MSDIEIGQYTYALARTNPLGQSLAEYIVFRRDTKKGYISDILYAELEQRSTTKKAEWYVRRYLGWNRDNLWTGPYKTAKAAITHLVESDT